MAGNGKTGKTTRAAAAVDKMMAGSQQRKVAVTLTGRAAEQWADLTRKGQALGVPEDVVAATLLELAYAALAGELDRRFKGAATETAAAKA